jgi:hypothetical protein
MKIKSLKRRDIESGRTLIRIFAARMSIERTLIFPISLSIYES